MKKNYMSNPSYNYEIVNRASLACGPMVKWAVAQVGPSPATLQEGVTPVTLLPLSQFCCCDFLGFIMAFGSSYALPSQLNYADMLKRVEPLRNELQKLEDDAKDNQQKANEVEQMIRDLEASIARYKEEYAVLISEAQAIKADLAAVEAKVSLACQPGVSELRVT